MTARPSGIRLLMALVAWAVVLVIVWPQATGPVPARNWQWGDLLTLRGWVEPMGFNTDRGRTGIVNPASLNSVEFVDQEQGWVVGEGGTILATQDGGQSWQKQTSDTTNSLSAVTFTTPTQGWVVGNGGTILATQNGGQSWQEQTSGTTDSLTAVSFTSPTQGWAVGHSGTILATQDGGQSWQKQTSGITNDLYAVTFTSPTQGWVVGDGGTILVTKDGGQSWQKQTSGITNSFYAVTFTSPTQGWVVGDRGTIMATQDAGQSWQQQTATIINTLYAVAFISPTQGWAVGRNGTILVTQNGGQSWQKQTSLTGQWLLAVTFTSPAQGWAVGDEGTILVTKDGGKSWQEQISEISPSSLNATTFTSPSQGWTVGDSGTILATQDGGQSWQEQTSGTTDSLTAVSFTSPTQGWAVGHSGTILATQDGGQSWQKQTSDTTNSLSAVTFTTPTQGWVVGNGGTILATQDGGQSWQKQTSGTTNWLTAVSFTSPTQGWAVGSGGTILATQDGGQSWQKQTSGTTNWLTAVSFTSPTQGWAVGSGGTILVTKDGGQSWQKQTSGTAEELTAVSFTSPTQGWAVGSGGTILVTKEGGQSWQKQTSGTTEVLTAVSFTSPTQGWAVGHSGTILATQSAGQTWQDLRPKPEFWRVVAWGSGNYHLWPSPATIVLIALLLWGLAHSFAQQLHHQRKAAKAGGIHDAPIEDLQSDRLQRAPLVRTLAALFRNMNTRPPLTVALTAPWGVGKSSVLHMLKDELQGHARCVYINPWHYPQDSQLLAALMTGICAEAVPPMLSLANLRFRIALLWERFLWPHRRWSLVWAGMLYFAFWPTSHVHALAVDTFKSIAWAHVLPSVRQTLLNMQGSLPITAQAWAGDFVQAAMALLGLLLFWRKGLKSLYTFSPSLTRALAQSAQWATKSMSLPDWSQHAGLRHQFAQDFKDITQAFGTERLVLLIDDLDRCEPNQVAQTLATLNFVFTNQARCFVVLAMDTNYVAHALGLAYNDMALTMRNKKSASSGADPTAEASDNAARLNFARHYVRKLVQLEVRLTHNKEQGALMVLDTLSLPEVQEALHQSSMPEQQPSMHWWDQIKGWWRHLIQTSVLGWVRARRRYHWQQVKRVLSGAVSTVTTLSWSRLKWWREAVVKRNLYTLSKTLWNFVKLLLRIVNAVLRLLGRWLQLGFNTALDARLHHWERIGNVLLVAASSYVAALLLTVLVVTLVPVLVPQTVPITTAKATVPAIANDSQTGNDRITEKNDVQANSASELKKPDRNNAGLMAVLKPDLNSATSWWPLTHMLAVLIYAFVIGIRTAQTVRDSEGFLLAVRHWHAVLSPRFPNPREWKRLSNMARFLAMRVRADQYQTRSERLAAWWQVQLKWVCVVFITRKDRPLPSPDSVEEVKPFSLSEGAAVELWMLDCLCEGRMRKLLPELLRHAAEGNSNRDTSYDVVKDLNDFKEFISSSYAYLRKGKGHMAQIEDSIGGQLRRKEEISTNKLSNSPNLPQLFQAWRKAEKSEVIAALQQWLAWTQDLRMDLSEEQP